jgi:hypothetical protein
MPRIHPLRMHELDDDVQHICREAEHQIGTSASTRTYAHHPPVVKALSAFRAALAKESVIGVALKELVRLKIARANACSY